MPNFYHGEEDIVLLYLKRKNIYICCKPTIPKKKKKMENLSVGCEVGVGRVSLYHSDLSQLRRVRLESGKGGHSRFGLNLVQIHHLNQFDQVTKCST